MTLAKFDVLDVEKINFQNEEDRKTIDVQESL